MGMAILAELYVRLDPFEASEGEYDRIGEAGIRFQFCRDLNLSLHHEKTRISEGYRAVGMR
jgi:hypothetical protein